MSAAMVSTQSRISISTIMNVTWKIGRIHACTPKIITS